MTSFFGKLSIQKTEQFALDLSVHDLQVNAAFLIEHHQKLPLKDLQSVASLIRELYSKIRPTLTTKAICR